MSYFLGGARFDIGHDNRCALGGEHLRAGAADAAAGAVDDCKPYPVNDS